MGATYTRQSSFTDGDVISAADSNDEFDQLLATFQATSGHTHDGTANEGGPITTLLGSSLTFGSGADSDITVSFNTSASDGEIKWLHDGDKFQFSDDILILDDEQLIFGSDSNVAISYDETTTDSLKIAATEGAGLAITLMADEGDDAGDEWKLNIADGGTLTLGNDIASAGSYVTHLTLTPNSTVASSTLAVAGNLTVGGSFTLGSGAVLSEAELEKLDGITNGTVAASKAMVVDANRDIGTVRNLTIDGTFSDGNYTFDDSGNVSGLGTVASGAITSSGIIKTDNTTDATTTTDGSLQTDGGLSVAKDAILGNDVKLLSDSAVLSLGAGNDITFTHDGTTGLTIAATPISIDSTGELHLNSTIGDIKFQDGGVDQIAFDLDGTAGEVIIKPAVDSDDLVISQFDGTEVIRIEDNASLGLVGNKLSIANSSSDVVIKPLTDAKDIIFQQFDGTVVATVEDNGTFNVPTGKLAINSTAITSTAAELNLLDTASANSVVNSKAVIYGSSGELAGTLSTAAQANITSVGTLTALSVDSSVAIDDKVITMTGSSGDTFTTTVGTNGATSLVTVDTAGAAAHLQITADGTVDIDSAGVLTLDSGAAINIEPASGSAILLDGTISIDAGVVTGATSITSTAFVGDITGDVTGTADVATVATTVTITDNESENEDNAIIFTAGGDVDGGNIGLESDGTLTYNPSTGKVTATGFIGALTGNVAGNLTGTVSTATQNSITTATGLVSVGALDSGSITSGFGAIDNGTSGIRTNTFTAETSVVPSANDGATLGTASLGFADLFLADGGVIKFGDDQDVTVTHDADDGLILKSTATGDDNPFLLTLQTGETDLAANDVIGKIAFQAPDEGTGTDAILVSAAIQARSEGDFAADANATSIDFMTGASEAAATKMSLTSAGVLSIPADGSDLTGVTNAIHLGASADMKIFHNGGNNYILTDQASQSFTVLSDIVRFNTRNNGESLFGATLDGGFFAKYDNTTTLQTISGGVQVDGDIVLGGSGNGINLGVTSNTDANTLDDFEEGTFTAIFRGSGGSAGSVAGNSTTGHYCKIGNLVQFAITGNLTNVGSFTGDIQVNDLPFTCGGNHNYAVVMGHHDLGSNTFNYVANVTANQNFIYVANPDSSTPAYQDVVGTGPYHFNGWYRTDV